MGFLTDDISINTILGEGSFFSQKLQIKGNVRIEGDVDGDINATGNVFIGEKARIKGDINAESAEIYGIVLGDIVAPGGIKILSTAAVIGDICSKKVQIAMKAIFHGHCISHKDEEAYKKSKEAHESERAVLGNKIGGYRSGVLGS